MINRIERPLANDHPDGSFSVHLFLHRPKTQISRIIGQYTHNLLGLKTLSFALLLSSTKIWIKGPQIGSDMPSALGRVFHEKNISEIVIEFLVFNIAKSTTYIQYVVSHCLTGYVLQRVSLLSS